MKSKPRSTLVKRDRPFISKIGDLIRHASELRSDLLGGLLHAYSAAVISVVPKGLCSLFGLTHSLRRGLWLFAALRWRGATASGVTMACGCVLDYLTGVYYRLFSFSPSTRWGWVTYGTVNPLSTDLAS